jgi:hypothetical protein
MTTSFPSASRHPLDSTSDYVWFHSSCPTVVRAAQSGGTTSHAPVCCGEPRLSPPHSPSPYVLSTRRPLSHDYTALVACCVSHPKRGLRSSASPVRDRGVIKTTITQSSRYRYHHPPLVFVPFSTHHHLNPVHTNPWHTPATTLLRFGHSSRLRCVFARSLPFHPHNPLPNHTIFSSPVSQPSRTAR